MNGYLYAIACGEMVKIGYSADPLRRRSKLQADNAGACTLLGVVSCSQEQEIELHSLLAKYRVSGEWYPGGLTPIEFLIGKLRALEGRSTDERRDGPPRHPTSCLSALDHSLPYVVGEIRFSAGCLQKPHWKNGRQKCVPANRRIVQIERWFGILAPRVAP